MDEACQRGLLGLARGAMQAHLAGRELPALPEGSTEVAAFGGVFVTLHRGAACGCIGRFTTDSGLSRVVTEMAVAVLSDPRFQSHPVTLAELPQITIEISVLSPMMRTHDPLSLVVGKHGVLIRQGHQSGCFLPQVAAEQGWSVQQLLSHCCTGKAKLSADAWRNPQTEVHLFEAEVFNEDAIGVALRAGSASN